MDNQLIDGDRLFLIAENLSKDFSLFPEAEDAVPVKGLLSDVDISQYLDQLNEMDIDSYIEAVISKAEDTARISAPTVIRLLGRVVEETLEGPFYSAKIEMQFSDALRLIGFIAQDRSVNNGGWMPEHHLAAADFVEECSRRALPIVSLMDTPGADASEAANANNQAHSISRLITEMSNVDMPNLGIVFGLGYSGGAIPLAASNMILAVRDGVFSTIQPMGLASIARRLNLSWQECAKHVGLSPYQLYSQGNIDGIIDFVPGEEGEKLENFRQAIVSGLESIEQRTKEFVAGNPYILEHYRLSLQRYLEPSAQLIAMQSSASLKLTKSPTEYLNVFGVAYRYLRYLKVRQRIRANSIQQYGRLATEDLPSGELTARAERDRRKTFLKWLQDPDRVLYDDGLSKAWRTYTEKKSAVHDERGRIAQLLFGEPQKNYQEARTQLLASVSLFLYNRWKAEAPANLRSLKRFLQNPDDTRGLFQVSDLVDPAGLVRALATDTEFETVIRERFSHEGKKLLKSNPDDVSDAYLRNQLANEINLLIISGPLVDQISDGSAVLNRLLAQNASEIQINRQAFDDRFGSFVSSRLAGGAPVPFSEMTILDVLLEDDLRDDFVRECENLLLFDSVYDQIIANLDSIAEEAQKGQSLSRTSLNKLLDRTLNLAAKGVTIGDLGLADNSAEEIAERLRGQFFDWYLRVARMSKSNEFFRAVEEWKKTSFPHLSDTLLVVVTFFFESLLVSYLQSEQDGKKYDGRIAPKNIGRRKDFWNRLDMAYQDLLIQNLLRAFKNKKATGYQAFIDEFFTDFEEHYSDLLSSDPCQFPGFRLSIEKALDKGLPPCGVVTGLGTFNDSSGTDSNSNDENAGVRVGTVISNLEFQAGAFDMASAEKFCKLLVECAEQHLPVICFISSGGMQTKEGAGALFSMAAINDRITRFVRDHDLPVIIFGFGDCTGGSQASFVTHPLVQTYYFSGTDMPFAGQIVVSSNLPSKSTLSNYLSLTPDSMQGLVKHPFLPDLDSELCKIDEEMPLPQDTVRDVVQRIMAGSINQARPVVVAHRPKYTDADLVKPVRRVLIHARGCTAAKLVRVAQQQDIEVVLVQSDPDMDSAIVDQLTPRDTVVCIGGNTPDESYLNAMSVLRVAEQEKVDALHPGIGFLSENSQFAQLVRNHGVNFIGPPISSMETMGNKSNAINTAMRMNVTVVPGSHGIVTDADRAAVVAKDIGYPVLIKAVHGGGGKGIQVVEHAGEFDELFSRVTVEARAAFGNGDVYLEKYVTSLRHIEVQLLRDTHGNTKVLGLRDCSVQRDKQKVIEESGSTMLGEQLTADVLRHTQVLADEVNYVGAGTVEFIYDLANDAVYFMEMNTRLQVEHPVTEFVSGIDIVAEQFRIAGGESIEHLQPNSDGYAIEARINAEKIVADSNGELQFKPDPGQVLECRFPQEEGVDVITSVSNGKFVSPYYDSMIAQVIVHAKDRRSAIAKLLGYLETVRVRGICTNMALLKRILTDDVFIGGEYDTSYLPGLLQRLNASALIAEIRETAVVADSGLDLESIKIEGSDEVRVLCPSTSIFYLTPSPSEPAYVSVGSRIDVNSTICQLEAFKIFSPLRLSDFNTPEGEVYSASGIFEVTRINMATGQQVNAGDLLFVIKPVESEEDKA